MKIQRDATVTLRCRVQDESGHVVDDGSKTFSYEHGHGMLLAGVENALVGRSAGYAVEVRLDAEEAYGPRRDALIFEAVRENLPPNLQLEPGMLLHSTGGPFPLTVVRLTERGAMLDGNHPLAGRSLTFQIEVIDVQPSAELGATGASACTKGGGAGCGGQCTERCSA